VSDPQAFALDVGGAHTSPLVGLAGHHSTQTARRGGTSPDRVSARASPLLKDPTRNPWHPVR
jgi:hypothetical protein